MPNRPKVYEMAGYLKCSKCGEIKSNEVVFQYGKRDYCDLCLEDYRTRREIWIEMIREEEWKGVDRIVETLDRAAGRRPDGSYSDVNPYLFCDICERPMINRAYRNRLDSWEDSFESDTEHGCCQICSGERKED